MTLPVLAVTLPSDLVGARNGELGPCHLTSVYFAGIQHRSIHPLAARAWNALAFSVHAATGAVLSASGSPYRTLQEQTDLFLKRYVKAPFNPLLCTVNNSRTWNGQKYYLRRGYAPCAVPATSNHGLAIAVDTAWYKPLSTPKIQGITSDAAGWAWLQANALKFGWSWESQIEPWHIRYVCGDSIPQAVLDFEKQMV